MTAKLEAVILGCGASGGVPRADGDWGACDPSDPRNLRSRCSLLVRRLSEGGPETQTTLVVDAAPEFRQQAVAARTRRLDALLFTHDHADQCHGLDDIRAFAMTQRTRIPCWADRATTETLSRRFGYIFQEQGLYPAIAQLHEVPLFGQAFGIDGPSGEIPVVTFDQDHGPIRSLGYRFGSLAYSSDVVDLPESAFVTLQDLDVWVVDALRYRPHPTHAHLAKALAWIERVRPKRAILTNMHVDLDYRELSAQLPPNVEPAFDGLRLEVAC